MVYITTWANGRRDVKYGICAAAQLTEGAAGGVGNPEKGRWPIGVNQQRATSLLAGRPKRSKCNHIDQQI